MRDPELDIPPAWQKAAERILQGFRRVLILGQTDAGKSSLCRYLCKALLEHGTGVAVIDADVGQKDIGPPACATLGWPEDARPLSETPAQGFYFVGSTDPIRHMTPLSIGAARLVQGADRPVVLVDTPGAVHGPGRALQGWLIEAVRPDLILAVEKGRELSPILDAHRHIRCLRLPRSAKARTKSAARRAAAREAAFARYLAPAREQRLALADLALQRWRRPGAGEAEPGLTGRLCGVADHAGDGLGLAILQAIDEAQGTARLITPVAPERIAALQLGDMRIDRAGRPLRETPPGSIPRAPTDGSPRNAP